MLKDILIEDNQKVSLEAAILERRRNSPLSKIYLSDNVKRLYKKPNRHIILKSNGSGMIYIFIRYNC